MKISLIISIIAILANSFMVLSQNNTKNILFEIENNNTELKAFQKQTESNKLAEKTGIFLKNPEIGFSYLFGSPSEIGNRTGLTISQSFDFPTTYVFKRQVAELKNRKHDLAYRKKRLTVLLEASHLISDLVYYNALMAEYRNRLDLARQLNASYKTRFDLGETNILEYNKARLNSLNINKENESIRIERQLVLSNLQTINGGYPIEFSDSVFLHSPITADFEIWYTKIKENIPELTMIQLEQEAGSKLQKLSIAQSLPGFSAGYMSEALAVEKFRGLMFGIAIPLWENKNTIKLAKAQNLALHSIEADLDLYYYQHLKSKYFKAIELYKTVEDYRSNLQALSNTHLLKKALEKGEINLIEFIMEQEFYYQSYNNLLEMERDFNKIVMELTLYE